MNFVAQVEEQLRDLGTEARKKHPGKLTESIDNDANLGSLQYDIFFLKSCPKWRKLEMN